MGWLAAIGIGLNLLSAGMSKKSADEGSDASRRLGELKSTYIGLETAEEKRRMQLSHDQTMNEAKNRIGASGISMEGTNKQYLDELENQFKGEMKWMEKAKVSRQDVVRTEAEANAKSSQRSGQSGMLGAASNIVSFFK